MIKKFLTSLFLKRRKEIPFIIFFTFLITFSVARIIAYAINLNMVPRGLFFIKTIYVRGYHIHHFNFGIAVLIIAGFLGLVDAARHHLRLIAVLYGIGLALIMDEFGLLVTLDQNVYWTRASYDGIIFTSVILLNVVYFRGFWKVMGRAVKNVVARFSA